MIDCHAHYLSPRIFDRDLRSLKVVFHPAAKRFEFPGGTSRPVPDALTDLDTRSSWTEVNDIELQVLSPWMDLIGDDLPRQDAVAWCRLLNDTTASDIDPLAGFRAFAALPVGDGPAAAAELARTVETMAFVGGAIPSQVAGTDLDEANLDPLFEAAVSLDIPLFIHPFRVMAPQRLQRYFLNNVCGVPFDTTVAALQLFFSGAMDRWPGLKLVLAHCGGALPFIAGRARQASRVSPAIDRAVETPGEILGRFYYDTMLHDPQALGFAASKVGVGRMVVGTDAPFPMQIEPVVDHLHRAFADLPKDPDPFPMVTQTTPRNLLGLG
ncbi:MAG: amidohydrolase [Akkermansiaceae bacterium]|nr:amidohydrolase [Akkermansiaceae bacterium]